tara:strand:+ start:1924 stop:2451 length:528 start_codon:yes stop_codon:yes gene_type:complete
MYFDTFPVIPYDSVGNYYFKNVTNLLRRVGLRSKIKLNTLSFDTYDVKGGETPEIIAHKLYGDPELHWIIMIVNDITDRYHQWPMTTPQFLSYVNEKYSDVNAVHHYEIEQTSGDTTIKIDIGSDNTNYPSATAITNYEYEEQEQDKRRKIRLLDPKFIDRFISEFNTLMNESVI